MLLAFWSQRERERVVLSKGWPLSLRKSDCVHSSSWRLRYSRSFWKTERPIAEGVGEVVMEVDEEDEVEEGEKRIGEVLESIGDNFIALDRAWCFAYINRAAEMVLGRRREELLGKNIWSEFQS